MKNIKKIVISVLAGAYMIVPSGCQSIKSMIPERLQEIPGRFKEALWGHDAPALDSVKNYVNSVRYNIYNGYERLIFGNSSRYLRNYS